MKPQTQPVNLKPSVSGLLSQLAPADVGTWFDHHCPAGVYSEQEAVARMNAFWRGVLMCLRVDTLQLRSLLDDSMCVMEWTIMFRTRFIPLLNSLPNGSALPWHAIPTTLH